MRIAAVVDDAKRDRAAAPPHARAIEAEPAATVCRLSGRRDRYVHCAPLPVQSGQIRPLVARRNGPIASASTGAEPKHSSASRGSSTIGRPAVLKLVLMTTGVPVKPVEFAQHARDERFVMRDHGLNARRSVDVHRRGRSVVPSGTNAMREEHVRAGQMTFKNLRRAFLEHHRRDGAELFAAFDVVQPLQDSARYSDSRGDCDARVRADRIRCVLETRRRRRRRAEFRDLCAMSCGRSYANVRASQPTLRFRRR